jgi:ribA/ribD-fused uncharacterized protein
MAEAFTFFWKSRLSQWQSSPFVLGGVRFLHAEQYMMYAKALVFGDRDTAERILAATTPREQQAIGRKLCPVQSEPRPTRITLCDSWDDAGGGVASRQGVGHWARG